MSVHSLFNSQPQQWIYHEPQQSALCGQHCLNNLLQGYLIQLDDLATIAQDLDAQEKSLMFSAGLYTRDAIKFAAEDSGNVALDGNFSIQVLSKALEKWQIQLIPIKSKQIVDIESKSLNGEQRVAFVCNLENHWFAIRKIYGKWWNLNSMNKFPEQISDLYLAMYIKQLQDEHYSIFDVVGKLPDPMFDPEDMNRNRWYTVSELLKPRTNQSNKEGDSNQAKGPKEHDWGSGRALAASTTPVVLQEDEDPELAAAIAASLQDAKKSLSTNFLEEIQIGQEPEVSNPDLVKIQFALPSGKSNKRNFLGSDSIAHLMKYTQNLLLEEEKIQSISNGFKLSSVQPRLSFSSRDDPSNWKSTLVDHNLKPSVKFRIEFL